jgi:hypothetical protein
LAKVDVQKIRKGDRLLLELEAVDVWFDDQEKVDKITVVVNGQRVTIYKPGFGAIVDNLGK